jgi:hypothetical protein
METVVGIFSSPMLAEAGVSNLLSAGLERDEIVVAMAGEPDVRLADIPVVPVSETEQPGVATAIGSVVGGAAGVFAGLSLVTLLVPGLGPIAVAGGLAASAAAGAVGGSLLGSALEARLGGGVPVDELYIYEDALRKGRVVVFVQVADSERADRAREILSASGADSIDAAREQWRVGLHSANEETYHESGETKRH